MILSGLKASVFLFVIQIHPCLTSPLCICVLFNANLMIFQMPHSSVKEHMGILNKVMVIMIFDV